MGKDEEEDLVKIEDNEKKNKPPRVKPPLEWDISKTLDQRDVNYRPPPYHKREDWE